MKIHADLSVPQVVALLLKDHRAMRKLMAKISSARSSQTTVFRSFRSLEDLVKSHMAAEEVSVVNHLKKNPKFEDEAKESYEEHRIHEHIFIGIHKLNSAERKVTQMKIYCEILEHHLKEEERDLFPHYREYFALSTRKAAGKKFMKTRMKKSRLKRPVGALAKG